MNAPATGTDLKRVPVNIEAEQALLGAVLVNNEAMDVIREARLEADHFYDPVHARIYAHMGELLADHRPVTPTTLRPVFEGQDIVGDLTVNGYIAQMAKHAVTVLNAKGYAYEIMASAARRRLIDCFAEALEVVEGTHTRGSVVIDETAERLQEIRDAFARGPDSRFTMAQAAGTALEDAAERMASDDVIAGMTTGLVDLDDLIGGWFRQEMVVIGGRPSMGKTALAASLLLQTANAGHGVLYFSLEMPAKRISERCLTDMAEHMHLGKIPYENIRRGNLTEQEFQHLSRANDAFQKLPFIFEQKPALNMVQMMGIARQVARRMERNGRRLDVICVDHMDKMKATSAVRGNMVMEAGEKSNALTVMAKELDVAVVALKQLSRANEGRENKRPTLSDLRMSGDVEQDADVILFPYREFYYLERQVCEKDGDEADRRVAMSNTRNVMELSIAKNRGGSIRTMKAYCDMATSAIRDMSAARYEP